MTYTETFYITSHDINSNGNVRPSIILRYMQEAADHHMRDKKPSYSELYERGMAFILSKINIKTYFPLHEYDKIEVQTWPCKNKGATFLRDYKILRNDRIMSAATSQWALVGVNDHRLYGNNEIDLSSYEYDEPLDIGMSPRFKVPAFTEMEYVGDHKVVYSEIDFNQHMNNTYYPDMLCNFIPDISKLSVLTMRMRFVTDAPLGQSLKIFRSHPVPGEKENQLVYSFRTLKAKDVNVEAQITVEQL